MAGTPIWILLKTVFQSILQVVLISLTGFIMAKKGILDKKVMKQLNRLNISVFTPALLFSKVAFSLTPEKLRELWVMPVFFVIVTGLSMVVVHIAARLARLNKMQTNFAVAASMFMNSNSLPVALMQSLVTTVPHLKWGDDDEKTAMLGRALTYLVLYSSLGMIVRWSYGVMLLSGDEEEKENEPSSMTGDQQPHLVTSPPVAEGRLIDFDLPNESTSSRARDADNEDFDDPDQTPRASSNKGSLRSISAQEAKRRGANPVSHIVFSFPNTPIRSRTDIGEFGSGGDENSAGTSETEEDGTDEPLRFASRHQFSGDNYHRELIEHHERLSRESSGEVLPAPTTSMSSARRRIRKFLKAVWKKLKAFVTVWNEIMTPPLYAAILSLIVALIPPVQRLLNEHAHPLKGALKNAGDCSIPITLIVLGGYFYTPDEEKSSHGEPLHHQTNGDSSQTLVQPSQSAYSHLNGIVNGHGHGNTKSRSRSMSGRRPSLAKRRQSLLSASYYDISTQEDGETKTIVIALLSRMLIVPVLLLPLFWLSTSTDWQDVFADPVFVVSCVLLASSPPAVTLAQIVPKSSGDAFERLISRTIFWAYCVLTPPSVIIYVVLGLWLAKL